MVKGVDELLEHLLYEIALAGERGAGAAEIQQSIKTFYTEPEENIRQQNEKPVHPLLAPAPLARSTHDDPRFLQKVWGWLMDHPDVFVKEDDNGGGFATDKLASRPTAETTSNELEAGPTSDTTNAPDSTAQPGSRTAPQDNALSVDAETNQVASGESAVAALQVLPTGLRVYTTEDRIWNTITGHGVDHKRVPKLEFEALRVIAAAGPTGIIQPKVRLATGQDKRSLPKRTGELVKKGYITKELVLSDGFKTSNLTLKKHISETTLSEEAPDGPRVFVKNGAIYYDVFFDEVMRILRDNNNIMQLEDLRKKLGILGKRWETKAFFRAIRRLDIAGCIKRLRARKQSTEGEAATTEDKWLKCVKLLRDPLETDRTAFTSGEEKRRNNFTHDNGEYDAEGEADDDAMDLDTAGTDENVRDGTYDEDEIGDLETSARIPPQWNPDRQMTSLIYDYVDNAGEHGVSSMDIMRNVLGTFWKRPMEPLLGRLTDVWQVSQPQHLRHLSIVRDTAVVGKFSHYQYRSIDNFQKAVDAGDTAWEAVLTEPSGSTKKKGKKADITNAEPELDQWGFPVVDPSRFADPEGSATLLQARILAGVTASVGDANDEDFVGIVGKPMPALNPQFGVKIPGEKRTYPNGKPTGRPRKYLKGEEPYSSGNLRKAKREKAIASEWPRRIRQYAVAQAKREAMVSLKRKAEEAALDAQPGAITTPVRKKRNLGQRSGTPASVAQKSLPDTTTSSNADSTRPAESILNPDIEAVEDDANITTPKRKKSQKQLEAETLRDAISEDRIKEIEAEMLDTSKPGVYITPPHAYNPDLENHLYTGHRRQYLIAVFKTPRLYGLQWFGQAVASTSQGHDTSSVTLQKEPSGSIAVQDNGRNVLLSSDLVEGRTPVTEPTPGTAELPSWSSVNVQPPVSEAPIAEAAIVEGGMANAKQASRRTAGQDADDSQVLPTAVAQPEINTGVTALELNPLSDLSERTSEVVGISHDEWVNTTGNSGSQQLLAQIRTAAEAGQPHATDAQRHASISTNEIYEKTTQGPTMLDTRMPNVPAGFTSEGETQLSAVPPASVEPQHTLEPQTDADSVMQEEPAATSPAASHNQRQSHTRKRAWRQPTKAGVKLSEGIVRLRRTKVILDIVRQANGAFPGHSEMYYPFTTIWMRQFSGKPDRDTIQKVIKGLIKSGKLQRLSFSFPHPNTGTMTTRSMIVEPGLTRDSPAVKEMQAMIIKHCPQQYIPPQCEVAPSLHSRMESSHPPVSQHYVYEAFPIDETAFVHRPDQPEYAVRLNKRIAASAADRQRRREGQARALRGMTEELTTTEQRNLQSEFQVGAYQHKDVGYDRGPSGRGRLSRLLPWNAEGDRRVKLTSLGALTGRTADETDEYQPRMMRKPKLGYDWEEEELAPGETIHESLRGPDLSGILVRRSPSLRPNHSLTGKLQIIAQKPTQAKSPTQAKPTQATPSLKNHQRTIPKRNEEILDTKNLDWDMTRFVLGSGTKSMQELHQSNPALPVHHPQKRTGNFDEKQVVGGSSPRARKRPCVSFESPSMAEDGHREVLDAALPASGPRSGALTFSHAGNHTYDHNWDKQYLTSLTDPRQTFHKPSGTFGTDFATTTSTRRALWVDPRSRDAHLAMSKDLPIWASRTANRNYRDTCSSDDTALTMFNREIELVRVWEDNIGLDKWHRAMSTEDSRFFQHRFPAEHLVTAQSDYNGVVWEDADPSYTSIRTPVEPTATNTVSRLVAIAPKKPPGRVPRNQGLDFVGQVTYREPTSGVASKAKRIVDATAADRKVRTKKYVPRAAAAAGKPDLDPTDIERLLFAIVAVRALLGGTAEKGCTNWFVVHQALEYKFDADYLRQRWSSALKYRLGAAVERILPEFQEAFVTAYERCELPSIDLHQPEEYDWPALVEWARENIDQPEASPDFIP
ncbi:hypothetical protein LTR66_003403, partial [Elasticomyces elasticus]